MSKFELQTRRLLKSQVKQARIFALGCATTCLLSFSSPVLAQEAQSDDEEIIILWDDEEILEAPATPTDSAHSLTLDAVDVTASPETLQKTGVRPEFAQNLQMPFGQSLNDWLESAPGVFGQTSSKGQRSILVRGFETRHISMEFDGIPLETGYDGMTGLDVLPLNWVSSAKLYHADTHPTDGAGLGGKAAFFALQPSLLEANLEISRGTTRGSIAHGMTLDQWRWAATAGGHYTQGFYLSQNYKPNAREDGGLRDHSSSQSYNAMLKIGRTLGAWGDLELSGGYAQAPRDVPTGTHSDVPRYWVFTDWKLAFASAKMTFTTPYLSGQTHFWFTHQSNTLNEYDDASRTTQTIAGARSIWKDHDFGGRLELTSNPWTIPSAGHISALLKADFHWQTHHVDDYNIALHTTSNTDSSRFLYDIRPAFDWQIIPQVRLFASAQAIGTAAHTDEANRDANAQHDAGFNLGLDYVILDNLTLGARVARRLRVPTMKEQFRSQIIGQTLPELNPESAWNFEMEMHYTPHPKVAISLGAYDTEVHNLIDFTYFEGIKLATNIDQSRLAGADIGLKVGPFWGLSLETTYSYLHAWNLKDNQALNNRPEHNLRATLTWMPCDRLRLAVQAQYESKRRTEAWMNTNHAWIGDIFLLNAEIEYRMEHFSLLLKGTNLTDFDYMRSLGFPEEGFDLTLSAKFTW